MQKQFQKDESSGRVFAVMRVAMPPYRPSSVPIARFETLADAKEWAAEQAVITSDPSIRYMATPF